MYMCDKHQVDLGETCLGALYLKSKSVVQKHCKFNIRPAQKIVYQITDPDHLVYSTHPKVYTIYCENGTQKVLHLEQASKSHVDQN